MPGVMSPGIKDWIVPRAESLSPASIVVSESPLKRVEFRITTHTVTGKPMVEV